MTGYELIRWARDQAHGEHQDAETGERRRLTPCQAHVLLILATYADKTAIARPTIETLALDTAHQPHRAGTTDTKTGRHSTISHHLATLENLGLIRDTSRRPRTRIATPQRKLLIARPPT